MAESTKGYILKLNPDEVMDVAFAVSEATMRKASLVVVRNVKKLLTPKGKKRKKKKKKGLFEKVADFFRNKKDEKKRVPRKRNKPIGEKKKKIHMPSAPGEPPALDTGTLRASIFAKVETFQDEVIGKVGPDIDKILIRAEAGTDVEYGYYLELGTSKMAARPYLRPGLAKSAGQIMRIFKASYK